MNKKSGSIDGFVARRRSTGVVGSPSNPQIGVARAPIGKMVQPVVATSQGLHKKTVQKKPLPQKPQSARPMARSAGRRSFDEAMNRAGRSDIESSLKAIDLQEKAEQKKSPSPEKKARRRKLIKWTVVGIVAVVLAIGVAIGVKAMLASNKSLRGGVFGFIQSTKLKQDANGRSNILIFGTSEDSDNGEHPGGNLTDSIMLLSVHQTKKDAFMVSLPRDLWVKLDTPCSVGYEEKLNVVYMCGSQDGKQEQKGADDLRKKVGQILGVDIQYYAHLNYKVVADAVDAVGGVDVKIETDDPRGIYDPNFDWKCNHQCKMVYYKQGEVAHLDGQHALALARARNAQGGYGLPGGNFDRERNQQKILRALQAKALSAGTLTNPTKVISLIDALGNNLRTNVETSEVRTLLDLAKDVQGDKLQSIALDDEDAAVVTTGNYQGRSIVRPVAGIFDYSGIKALIVKKISDNPILKESAKVAVYNGSGIEGLAKREGDTLETKGVSVAARGNAPGGNRQISALYQVGEGYAATRAMLEQRYGVKVTAGSPPVTPPGGVQFVIVLGTSAGQQQTQ